tara:strand:+ start:232 stop:750 length:519 start_codon:yes stop_codon:yes gene_type:complete
MKIKVGNNYIGDTPAYMIAEIGINHNGDLDLAKKLIKHAKDKGFDVVKFQKRVPELCVPESKRQEIRVTPWGKITYFQYKEKIEFWKDEYDEIDKYCKSLDIKWSASAWDIESIKFLQNYNIPFLKIPSDKSKDINFIKAARETNLPIFISTGGTSFDEMELTFKQLDAKKL